MGDNIDYDEKAGAMAVAMNEDVDEYRRELYSKLERIYHMVRNIEKFEITDILDEIKEAKKMVGVKDREEQVELSTEACDKLFPPMLYEGIEEDKGE